MKTYTVFSIACYAIIMASAHRAQPNKDVEKATNNTPPKMPTLTTVNAGNQQTVNKTVTATETTTKNCTTDDATRSSTEPLLIDSYLAPSMQAIAYYIEMLQYEPAHMTTLEPPFSGWEAEGGTTYKPPATPPRPITTTTVKPSTVWWKPPVTQSTIWWVPSTTTRKPTTTTSSTSTVQQDQTTHTTFATTQWWQKTTTTTRKPTHPPTVQTTSQTWWQPPSWWTTAKPSSYKPPTTTNPPETTPHHRPGLFAPTSVPAISTIISSSSSSPLELKPQAPPAPAPPSALPPVTPTVYASNYRPQFTSLKRRQNRNEAESKTTERFGKALTRNERITEGEIASNPSSLSSSPSATLSSGSGSHSFDKDFYSWFTQKKGKIYKPDYEYDFQLLDPLPGALIRDIIQEKSELPAINDVDNVMEFLRIYDDQYGRLNAITGKKRVPITKPFVDFLMLYDMLKRDAKAMNLARYEGYSEEMLHELAELSQRSAERQLHTLLTRMLLRNDIDRSDTISRVKGIIKDLETPTSITAKAMRYFPPLQFVP